MLKIILPIVLMAQVARAQEPQEIRVTSSGFNANEAIPSEYTCTGEKQSPPLSWGNVPNRTKSIAIMADDPDAPNGTYTHWIVTNLPPTMRSLPTNATMPAGAADGKNDAGMRGYTAPCPTQGRHHYVFKVYALDRRLDTAPMTRQRFLTAIEGHVIGRGQITGVVEKTP